MGSISGAEEREKKKKEATERQVTGPGGTRLLVLVVPFASGASACGQCGSRWGIAAADLAWPSAKRTSDHSGARC